ncbi:MAG: hypothetical protein ABIP48_11075 [Planctomycetota bacterium]
MNHVYSCSVVSLSPQYQKLAVPARQAYSHCASVGRSYLTPCFFDSHWQNAVASFQETFTTGCSSVCGKPGSALQTNRDHLLPVHHDVDLFLERLETRLAYFDGVLSLGEDGFDWLSVVERGEGGLAVVDGDGDVGFDDVESELAEGVVWARRKPRRPSQLDGLFEPRAAEWTTLGRP